MRNLLPIGRFSEVCRLSIPALRHYDELGLLPPAAVDRDTGYRYYSISQAADAELIRTLRILEMPLPEIRDVLAATGNPNRVRELLLRHRERLQATLDRQYFALDRLDAMLREAPAMTFEVRLRESQELEAATIRGTVEWPQIGPFFGQAFGEICKVMGEQGIRFAGPPFTVYHHAEMSESEVDMEVAVPVAEPIEPAGRVSPLTIPGGLTAVVLHSGGYDELGQAYQAIAAWIAEHGHEMAGPPREVYLVGPNEVQDPGALRTEIVWPIR